jgi:hypothetical protein
MKSITVILIGKDGCHLCDEADVVMSEVIQTFSNVTLETRSIDDDPVWASSYGDKIPVVLVEGTEFAFYRVNPDRLTRKLVELGAVWGEN